MDTKEYIATVKMGIETDTLDITGNIKNENNNFKIEKEELEKTVKSFKKEYLQTVPYFSAVKIKGKRLYEYAREKEEIELPKRMVKIYDIELLDYDNKNQEFTFRTLVSKGTYIRSLIKDIGDSLNIPCTMKNLIRTKSGKFKLEDSNKIDNNYKIIRIKEALDIKTIKVEGELLKKVENGNIINLDSKEDLVLLINKDNQELAIYKNVKNNQFKSFKVF